MAFGRPQERERSAVGTRTTRKHGATLLMLCGAAAESKHLEERGQQKSTAGIKNNTRNAMGRSEVGGSYLLALDPVYPLYPLYPGYPLLRL